MRENNKNIKNIEDLVPLDNIEDLYPMSDIQKGMVYHTEKSPDISKYHNQIVNQYRMVHFDLDRLKKAFVLMVDKHPILRTGFNMYDFEEPIQIVRKKVPLDMEYDDISHLEKVEQEKYIKKSLAEDRKRPFNFNNANPLWRLKFFSISSEMIIFAWIGHHSLMDGWSLASLLTEVYNTYIRLESDPFFIPVKLKNTYKQFVLEQMVESKNRETANYWKKQLAGYRRVNFGMTASKSEPDAAKEWHTYQLGPQWLEKLKLTAGKYDTCIKHLCFAAYVYSISLLSHKNDFVVGLVTNTRPQCEDGDKILGCLLNTVPVRMKIPYNEKWADYIHQVEKKMRELKKYDKLSLYNILKATGEQTLSENPIFDTLFNFVDFFVYRGSNENNRQYTARNRTADKLAIDHFQETNTLYDFNVDITQGKMDISISYDTSVFSKKIVKKLCRCFENVLNNFIYEPGSFIKKDSLVYKDDNEVNSFKLAAPKAKIDKIEFNF